MKDLIKWHVAFVVSIAISVYAASPVKAEQCLTDAEISFHHDTYIDLQECKTTKTEISEEKASLVIENTALGFALIL